MPCKHIVISKWNFYRSGGYKIIVAKTLCERWQGLQNAMSLEFPINTIMLFPNTTSGSFHTRNCKFPIEMLFISRDRKLLSFIVAKPNLSNIPIPSGTFYVLEANVGFSKANNLQVNDLITFISLT